MPAVEKQVEPLLTYESVSFPIQPKPYRKACFVCGAESARSQTNGLHLGGDEKFFTFLGPSRLIIRLRE